MIDLATIQKALDELAKTYQANSTESKSHLKNAEVFVVTMRTDFPVLPYHRLMSVIRGNDPLSPRVRAQETSRYERDFISTGYRRVSFDQPGYGVAWDAYIDTCEIVGTTPSVGKTNRKERTSFFVPENLIVTGNSRMGVLTAMEAYDPQITPEGFRSPQSWFVLHPDSEQVYPAKIIWGLATGQVGNEFTSHQARDSFAQLGFVCVQLDPDDFGPVVDPNAEPLVEGAERQATRTMRERNPVARKLCIEHYRNRDDGALRCFVCRIDFAETYGELGAGFIHVHHLNPLAEANGVRSVSPEFDLVPVCPNCHAMIHRGGVTRTLSEVMDAMQRRQ